MKKLLVLLLIGISTVTLFTGCLGLQVGGGTKTESQNPTVGQQLIDLQKAKEAGAITQAEYQTEKTKLLGNK